MSSKLLINAKQQKRNWISFLDLVLYLINNNRPCSLQFSRGRCAWRGESTKENFDERFLSVYWFLLAFALIEIIFDSKHLSVIVNPALFNIAAAWSVLSILSSISEFDFWKISSFRKDKSSIVKWTSTEKRHLNRSTFIHRRSWFGFRITLIYPIDRVGTICHQG